MNRIQFLVVLGLLFMASCNEEEDALIQTRDVLVVNEGNFLSAEGSFSDYNFSSQQSTLNIFQKVNGFAVGATIQRVAPWENNYVVTTNNPDRLDLITAEQLQYQSSISTGLATPISFAASGNIGFVTNWGTYNASTWQYDNPFLAIIDLENFTLSSTIPWSDQPNDLLVIGNELFISNVNSNTISVMDLTTLNITGTIVTPDGPDKMALDAQGDMWVICTSGNFVEVDPSTKTVLKTIPNVITSGFNEKMVFNDDKTEIYFLSTTYDIDYNTTTSVYVMPTTSTTVPTTPLITGTTYYAIGYHNGSVYVGDHNGFQGNGTVIILDESGNNKGTFECGIAPNGFLF